MTLQEQIEIFVSLGEKEPKEISRKVRDLGGDEWLADELLLISEEIVSGMAQRALSSVRRSKEATLRSGDAVSQSEIRIAKVWIPKSETQPQCWKSFGEVTRADLMRRAEWLRAMALASERRADWCEEVASLMEEEGAETLAALNAELPALPHSTSIEDLLSV